MKEEKIRKFAYKEQSDNQTDGSKTETTLILCGYSRERANTIKRQSFRHHGSVLFNMIPGDMRIFQGTVLKFKSKLDKYLQQLPYQPKLDGYVPGAVNLNGKLSNSLVDWMRKIGV